MRRLCVRIVFVWSFACTAYGVNVCRDECNDGGCAYTDERGAHKGCDCRPFNRYGSECESYTDVCGSETFRPCMNGGKCVSSLGSAYCDCPTGYHGSKCSDLHNDSDTNYPKRPSLYYRTKVRPGELIITNIIIENDDTFKFTLQLSNDAVGTFANYQEKKSMTTDQYYSICMNKMGSKDFPMNKNMCNFVKTTYGDSKITVLNPKPYFIPKTRVKRNDVYFNGDRNAGRMGGTYMISTKVYDDDMNDVLLSYDFYHLVVDDELSNCLPFVDPGENCKSIFPALKVKRSEDVPTIKIIITPDNEMCNKTLDYNYEWKVVDGKFPLHYEDEYHGIVTSKKIIDIDDKILKSRDLVIRQYTLPEGPLTLKLKLSMRSQEDDLKQYTPIRYMCYIDVSLDTLHAEIVGNTVRQVSNIDLVTLDASPSYNPNEPKNKQDQMLYTWHCDVDADEENCREYKTSNPVRNLMAPLNKAKKYVFKLITQVNNHYMEHVGIPKEGTTTITLIPKSFVLDVSIKCIKNCGHLSNPLEIIYLEAQTHCKNCSFEWYYNEQSSSTFISTETIRQLNTPHYVFIVLKRSLGFNTAYTFKAKDTNTELESSMFIRTAATPIAGECHVNPSSGMAGTTLFTITCSNFQDVYGVHSLFYYCYERYESDQDGLGLLIDHGSDKLKNIKLSTSGKLSVLVINSFGIYTRVNFTAQIFKSNTSQLGEKFKIMKNKLLNGKMSATVQMLSVICDELLSRKINGGFSTLFDTLSRIPSEGCNFCIEQTVLALKKVVHACSEVNDHKITPADALAISKNLLLRTSEHYEYIKTARNGEIIAEVERIERIHNSIKNILDILIREVAPIIYKNDTVNSIRYFWSSLEHMTLVTQNVEETLKIFGESIVFHQIIFEKHKSYESTESYFWANMLNADMLKEENNIISNNLANELLANKEIAWGFKIFEINKKLALWTEQRRRLNHVKSNVKYVALSAHDGHNRNYLGLIDKFVSPASIIFNVTETVDELDMEYTIRVPAPGSEQIEFDKAIRVFRLDMMEVGAIFITIKKSSHALLVAWTRNRRPDFKMMSDKQYVTKISVNGYHNFTFQTRKDHQNDIHYIGIFVDTVINSSMNNSYDVKFKMNTICMQCLYWKNTAWTSEGMEIGINSSIDGNVHCSTYHFSLFSSSIYVPPNLLNPIDDIHLFSTIANNMVCLILLVIIFIIYIVLLYWSNVQDKMDIFMSRIIILPDNYMCENEVYLVTVYTGHGIGCGTTACVCIELNGTIRSSRVHWLRSLYYRTLQRSNDDWFLIFTPQTLGDLRSIRVWHDNYGTGPDWYCRRIIVTEIRRDKTWTFEVERWFSLRRPTENIEHIIYTAAIKHDWKKDTKENVGSGIREKHLWASVFIRHPRSSITRCQRLSVILCAILSIMLSSMMFYETQHTDEEEFGKFELRLREFTIAFQSLIVEMVSTFSVYKCFNPILLLETTLKKIFDFIIGRFMVEKNVYFPADIEPIIERHQWNRWFIVGWIYCVTVYIFTTFFIILYGLKFGRIKSLCWLTSITIGILNGVVVSSPFKIILISVILAMYSNWRKKEQILTYNYNLSLNRYRKKTLILSQDIEFMKWNRKNRRRRFYLPLTSKAVDILRHRIRIAAGRNSLIIDMAICMIFILTSLYCIYNFNVFDKQNDIYRANRIVSEYLDCILFESNDRRMSLHNLKELLSFKLLKMLHSLELYNGMPITNDTAQTIEHDKRGWFGLYHGRLIGGGVILKQRRVKSNGENDDGSYGPGWTERVEVDNGTTPWTYFEPHDRDFLFFENLITDDTLTGYELHLTGGLAESKSMIDQYLKSKWLDTKTRRLHVQFQIYTPNADLVTMVEISMATECGLLYTISTNANVQTAPASSLLVADDRAPAHAFTAIAVGALTAASVARPLARAVDRHRNLHRNRRRNLRRNTRTAYDALLAALAVATAVALLRRLTVAGDATARLAAGAGRRVDLTPALRSHAACTRCAAALTAAALLRLTAALRPSPPPSVPSSR